MLSKANLDIGGGNIFAEGGDLHDLGQGRLSKSGSRQGLRNSEKLPTQKTKSTFMDRSARLWNNMSHEVKSAQNKSKAKLCISAELPALLNNQSLKSFYI